MGLLNALTRTIYMPLCRAYARHFVGDKPADRTLGCLASLFFYKVHGYWPNLKSPRSFEEKVVSRMLFDRNPLWTLFSDKLRVRDYVAERVGEECLVPLLWHGENPDEIPFDEFPSKFVIKTNHGCYYNIIVTDKAQLDLAKTRRKLRGWLGENFGEEAMLGISWAYKDIKSAIIVETFLDDNGKVPTDYKFFCFSGRMEYIQMNFDRFQEPYEKFFDRDFNPLDLWQGTRQYPSKVTPPKNYDEMIRIAETLASGFDFLRVDLYNLDGRLYFGEITCYPAAGSVRFIPESFDFAFGEKWTFVSAPQTGARVTAQHSEINV